MIFLNERSVKIHVGLGSLFKEHQLNKSYVFDA